MQFFIDTANYEEIKEAYEWGILAGVTTNPSLVAKEPGVNFHDRLREIAELVNGSVSGEVISLDAEGMIREGEELAAIHPNITVKLPMTPAGLTACRYFADKGIKTNVTLIFSANQALMAARAGATYVSPLAQTSKKLLVSSVRRSPTIFEAFASAVTASRTIGQILVPFT